MQQMKLLSSVLPGSIVAALEGVLDGWDSKQKYAMPQHFIAGLSCKCEGLLLGSMFDAKKPVDFCRFKTGERFIGVFNIKRVSGT